MEKTTMSDAKQELLGVFMYGDQLELIIEALAYYGGNAYMSEDKLERVDDLLVQLEEGQYETLTEGEIVSYYVDEDDDDGIIH
jgi:hypothetical protein